jgi:hypothetical protein
MKTTGFRQGAIVAPSNSATAAELLSKLSESTWSRFVRGSWRVFVSLAIVRKCRKQRGTQHLSPGSHGANRVKQHREKSEQESGYGG